MRQSGEPIFKTNLTVLSEFWSITNLRIQTFKDVAQA